MTANTPAHFPQELYRCVKCDTVTAPLPDGRPPVQRGPVECPVCHDRLVYLGKVLVTA